MKVPQIRPLGELRLSVMIAGSRNKACATVIEYGLIAALIGIAFIAFVTAFDDKLGKTLNEVGQTIEGPASD